MQRIKAALKESYNVDHVAFYYEMFGTIFTVEALGGMPRPVIKPSSDAEYFQFPTWSRTGSAIAYTSGIDSVHFLQLGASSPYLSVPFYQPHSLSWSPDGKYLAVVKQNVLQAKRGNNIAPTSIWLVDATDGAQHQITGDEFMDLSPRWTPDASSILYISNH